MVGFILTRDIGHVHDLARDQRGQRDFAGQRLRIHAGRCGRISHDPRHRSAQAGGARNGEAIRRDQRGGTSGKLQSAQSRILQPCHIRQVIRGSVIRPATVYLGVYLGGKNKCDTQG